ncbi:CPBP family glutamic-type intramembrane protease [Cellulosilyticum sp. I15G10I2]|uniref:CPBP family glutamic-type intramembrane protease n=1 Tax=Cellulosilyticum sp. I15G10I2 TaxID=1892843 RepID=UPI00085CCC69|nr:CPBP family glutamic-type intramembrane protease [Cellulosilyticum sp. I15G10I2]
MNTLQMLISYFLRIFPGIGLIMLVFVLIKPNVYFRTVIYIFAFILVRDAMTPLGLWTLGKEKGIIWLRMSSDPIFLIIFAGISLIAVFALHKLDKENGKYLMWFRDKKFTGLIYGILGCIVVVTPFLILYSGIDINNRGGSVNISILLPLLLFSMFGNLLEECLFRGYALGILKNSQNCLIAGINTGVIFAACHIFLAITVTDIGLPILIFTLWEGIIAGLVGSRYGVIPATITHGGAIFILSAGLI